MGYSPSWLQKQLPTFRHTSYYRFNIAARNTKCGRKNRSMARSQEQSQHRQPTGSVPWRGSGAPSGPWDPADSVAWLPTGKSPVPHNRKNTRPTTASIRLHQQQYSNIAMEEQHSPFSSTLQSAMARETVMALNFSRLTADDDLFLSPLQGASISENVTTTNIVPPNSRSQAEMHSVQQKLQQQQQQQHGNPRATASSSMVASTQLP
eukprot:CAMPEP_0171808012 /NCGR_PEP_ID=MMETSP0991-20121206/76137_1 /TAXON_ID=483369 /ORGANISM="non described non described, Strain CCMP2098" /LENGTH=206 /DNA_ID=CAMNT_0012420863 /DNA_START=166 /DNA_END=783 /DNA_ORIENTATION=-